MTSRRRALGILCIVAITPACGDGQSSSGGSGGSSSDGGRGAGGSAGSAGNVGRSGGTSGTPTASTGGRAGTGGASTSSGGSPAGGAAGGGGARVGTGGTTGFGGATVDKDAGAAGGFADAASSASGGRTGTGGALPGIKACGGFSGTGTETAITLDGNNVKATNVNGLTFKGFGVLSANGTSAVLMDYKSQHPDKYAELLEVLFGGPNPLITQVKIEMGNDRNNSTGPDAATMRLASEAANVRRAPGFQLAADAKKRNPDLKVSILRWNSPAWVKNNDNVYTWYKNTILAAYRTYGFMVDYVNPGVNERGADLSWTKQYASKVRTDTTGFADATEQSLFGNIKVVISDEAGLGSFGGDLVGDASLRDAVAVAGYHYFTDDDASGNFTKLAEQLDKEVWNSEAQATFSNTAFRPTSGSGIGGPNGPLEMGNTIIKGFVKSRRTHFIYQPAIGSFYEGGQYSFKELVSARDPWSGWIHYDAGLQGLRHFSWFAKVGWENKDNTAGIWRVVPQTSYTGATGTNPVNGRDNATPSYMTLAAPDKKHFSTVFMNDSSRVQVYKLKTANMAFTGTPSLELWETRAADTGAAFNSNYMKYVCNLSADASGGYTIAVRPWSVVTASTLVNVENPAYHVPLPVEDTRAVLDTDATGAAPDKADKILYADDFEYATKTVPVIGTGGQVSGTESYVTARGGPQGVIPRYTCDRNGAFEVYQPSGSTNFVLRQQLDQPTTGVGSAWNAGNPITGIGDNRWLDYRASVDVSFENSSTQSGNNYAAIGARQQGGEKSHDIVGTPYFLKYLPDGSWQLLVDGTAASSGNVVSGTGGVTIPGFKATHTEWHNLAIEVVGKKITAYLDGTLLATYTDSKPRLSGRVDLASGPYFTRFDNLKVETVDGAPPYYAELLDNLETSDLASPPAGKLVYGGSWSHKNGQGMYNYQRSLSTGGSNATLKYTFNGTGLDVLGPNAGGAKLEVTVDGQVTEASASTMAATELYQTFALRGLAAGAHTVQLKVLSGNLTVDAVGVVAAPIP